MLPWFLEDPARLDHERNEIESLASSSDWLVAYQWKVGPHLEVLATVRAHGSDYQLRAVFPGLFPDAAIEVYPLGEDDRLSSHQYGGADGQLCLEYGPDTWNASVTCALMLTSAWRLFETEDPRARKDREPPIIAPSRHRLTTGQEVRNKPFRWYLSPTLADYIAQAGGNGTLDFSCRSFRPHIAVLIHKAGTAATPDAYTEKALPDALEGDTPVSRYAARWFVTNLPGARIVGAKSYNDITELLEEESGLSMRDFPRPDGISGILIRDTVGDYHFFIVLTNGEAIPCTLLTSETVSNHARAPKADTLQPKRAGIVGLGSAGSKVAETLARMGCRSFLLVDHDIFLPENIARHALDWAAVTQMKVDGVAAMLGRIDGRTVVDTSTAHLTGQEANGVVNAVLDRLAACDVIIDASGDAKVLNTLSAISRRRNIPLVWLQVFAGGVGGLVARSRPGIDASAQAVRATYDAYCRDNPAPEWMRIAVDYTGSDASGETLVADDAEVSILAHHAARFAQDCFNPWTELFPYQIYLIGLAAAWVFHQPFEVIPLVVDASLEPEDSQTGDSSNGITFLASLFEKQDDPAPTTE